MIKLTLAKTGDPTVSYFNASHIIGIWESPVYFRGGNITSRVFIRCTDGEVYEVTESMETALDRLRQIVGVGDCE